MNIVTHVAPDFDAIGAVWLLQRFGGLESADVRFVNTGKPDPMGLILGYYCLSGIGPNYPMARSL